MLVDPECEEPVEVGSAAGDRSGDIVLRFIVRKFLAFRPVLGSFT
jgi:hypothetical protein